MFDEKLSSDYINQKTELTTCNYYTLPIVDGNMWSDSSHHAGLRLKAIINNKEVLIEGGTPDVSDSMEGKLHVSWTLKNTEGYFIVDFDECGIQMKLESNKSVEWFLDFTTAINLQLPIAKIRNNKIECKFKDIDYRVDVLKGLVSVPKEKIVYRITPEKGKISLDFSKR
jgi:uncharacterized cupredoxin-like copper-binding protein